MSIVKHIFFSRRTKRKPSRYGEYLDFALTLPLFSLISMFINDYVVTNVHAAITLYFQSDIHQLLDVLNGVTPPNSQEVTNCPANYSFVDYLDESFDFPTVNSEINVLSTSFNCDDQAKQRIERT